MTTKERVNFIRQYEARNNLPADSLLNAIIFETAGTLRTDIQNKYSNATGLIQFMPETAKGLKTTIDELKKMNFQDQFKYVDRYLMQYKNQISGNVDPFEVYCSILFPAMLGRPDSFIFSDKEKTHVRYLQNKGLDFDANGIVTKGEIKRAFNMRVKNLKKSISQKIKDFLIFASNKISENPGTSLFIIIAAVVTVFF